MSKQIEVSGVRTCARCHVNIVDESIECPLCRGVLDLPEGADAEMTRSVTYPAVSEKFKVMHFVIRLVFFVSVVASVVMALINYLTFDKVPKYWSLIAISALAFGYVTMVLLFKKKRSLQKTLILQAILCIIFICGLDAILGWSEWSVRYAIPIMFMAMDGSAVVLMIVIINGWQNYIITEIIVFVGSVALLILGLTHVLPMSVLTCVAAGVSALILFGTIVFGEKMISNEIMRRFRI